MNAVSVFPFVLFNSNNDTSVTEPRIKPGTLCVRDDAGGYRVATADELIQGALEFVAERMMAGPTLTNPRSTREYLALKLAGLPFEIFGLLHLDNRNRVLACEELFRGTIDGATVHPREVVKSVLDKSSCAVILYHNHPSGVAEPSQADELITRRLRDALALIDVKVLDHLVIGGATVESFAERGLL